MELYCPSCGATIASKSKATCPECRESMCGASHAEAFAFPLTTSASLTAPGRCACCLQETDALQEYPVVGWAGQVQLEAKVPIRCCGDCEQESRRTGRFKGLVAVPALLVSGLVFLGLTSEDFSFAASFVLTSFAFMLLWAGSWWVFRALGLVASRAGHTLGCEPVAAAGLHMVTGGGSSSTLVKIEFRNRAYAQLYRATNGRP